MFYGLNDLFEYLYVFYNSNNLLLGLPMEPLNTPENTPEGITYNSSSTGSNTNSTGSNTNPVNTILNPVTEVPNQGNGNPSEHPQTPSHLGGHQPSGQPSEHPQTPSNPSGQGGNNNGDISDADSNGYFDSDGHHHQWFYTPTPPGGHSPDHQTFWERMNNPRGRPSFSDDGSPIHYYREESPSPNSREESPSPRNREEFTSPNNGEGSSGSKRPHDGSGEGSSGSKRPKI